MNKKPRHDNNQKRKRDSSEKGPKQSQEIAEVSLPPPPTVFPKFIKSFWILEENETTLTDELKSKRKELGILVKGSLETCPPPVSVLTHPKLPSHVFAKFFKFKELQKPTPIQAQCWPAILAGSNVLGIAPTGSGKTLAYVLPIVYHAENQKPQITHTKGGSSCIIYPSGLILVPTRELAIQVHAVLKSCKSLAPSLAHGIVYGGQDKEQQLDKLKATLTNTSRLVLVATPGRLLDLMQIKDKAFEIRIDLSHVSCQVIDEADRMLSLGFAEQLTSIHEMMSPNRQMILYSATFPGKLRELCDLWAPQLTIVRCNTVNLQDTSQTPLVVFARDQIQHQLEQDDQQQEEEVKKAKENVEDDKKKTEVQEHKEQEEQSGKKIKITKDNELNSVSNATDTTTVPAATAGNEEKEGEDEEEDGTAAVAYPTQDSITINPSIAQTIHICAAHKRPRLLMKFIETIRTQEKATKQRQAEPMIIFVNKIKTLGFVMDFLTRQKIIALPLHGNLPQSNREENLLSFKAVSVQ